MEERREFWRHRHFRDLALLKARFRRHRYELHTHPTYVVALITGGCERVRVGRRSVVASAGTVLVVNPEEWHDGEAGAEGGWAYRTLYPSVPMLTAIATELGQEGPPLFPYAPIEDEALARAMGSAHERSRSPDATSAEASLLVALRHLILRHTDRVPRPEQVDDSGSRRRLPLYEEVIERNLASDLDLRRLGEAAGVTRFQVIRDFKKAAGVTPSAFIRDRRLRRAGLLIEQGAPLALAAVEAGFADQSHLTRTFRAMLGITPGMLQRTHPSVVPEPRRSRRGPQSP
jgi:AraC-like DNA-binding protein